MYIAVYGVCFVCVCVGTHRGRGGRGRANKAAQSVGLSLSYLVASGVRVDVLQRLLPRAEGEGEGGHRQLIPFDQVFLRGEDITGEAIDTAAITTAALTTHMV